jgi:hypothetical protein
MLFGNLAQADLVQLFTSESRLNIGDEVTRCIGAPWSVSSFIFFRKLLRGLFRRDFLCGIFWNLGSLDTLSRLLGCSRFIRSGFNVEVGLGVDSM